MKAPEQETSFIQYALVLLTGDSKGSYIHHTGGGWGPEYLPTKSLQEALKFDSKEAAGQFVYYRDQEVQRHNASLRLPKYLRKEPSRWWGGVMVVPVQVSMRRE